MVNQRSKSGCWTCRLRRKKCAEDGLPCSNCETRGVDCHGYGPRPAWKDRGHQEKQEADRLQLRRRNQATRRPSSSNTTDATVENSIYCLSPSMAFASPTADLASSSFPSSSVETPIFPFPSGSPSHLDPSDLTLLPDFWVPDFEEAPGTSPFCDNPSITIPAPPGNTLENAPQDQDLTPLASFIEAGVTSLEFPSNRLHPSEEREVELMMQYLEEDFPKQHPSYCPSAVRVQAWLMCTFRRSRTFLYASLCISAYFNFLKAPSHDGARQTELFREYDRLKHMAAKAHALLMEASSKRESQKLTRDELDFMLGETIIASVQLAILEVSVYRRAFSSVDLQAYSSPVTRGEPRQCTIVPRFGLARIDSMPRTGFFRQFTTDDPSNSISNGAQGSGILHWHSHMDTRFALLDKTDYTARRCCISTTPRPWLPIRQIFH